MTPGQACYYDLSASEWVLLDANVEHSSGVGLGVVIVGAAEDAHGIVCTGGPIDLGTTLTNGMPVIGSTTAGALAPVTDWSGYSAAWQYHFGYPSAASVLYLKPFKTLAEVA